LSSRKLEYKRIGKEMEKQWKDTTKRRRNKTWKRSGVTLRRR